MVEKTPNYTAETIEKVKAMYAELGNDGLETIAKEVGKTVRSVRSKLVKEGLYVTAPKPVRAKKNEGPSKKELIAKLTASTKKPLDGIEGASKSALTELVAYAEGK